MILLKLISLVINVLSTQVMEMLIVILFKALLDNCILQYMLSITNGTKHAVAYNTALVIWIKYSKNVKVRRSEQYLLYRTIPIITHRHCNSSLSNMYRLVLKKIHIKHWKIYLSKKLTLISRGQILVFNTHFNQNQFPLIQIKSIEYKFKK